MARTAYATIAKRTAKGKIQVSEKYFNFDFSTSCIGNPTCKAKSTLPGAFPAVPSSNLHFLLLYLAPLYSFCAFLNTFGLFQNLTGYYLL